MKLWNRINNLVTRAATISVADLRREEGQTLVEYGLIIALVAVILVTALTTLQGKLTGVFTTIGNSL